MGNSSVVGSGIRKLRGTLIATIDSAGHATLSRNGKGVAALKAGRYKITVDDRTPRLGFAIERLHRASVVLTGATFVGRHTVTVTLSAGRWQFYSSTGAKHDFDVVA